MAIILKSLSIKSETDREDGFVNLLNKPIKIDFSKIIIDGFVIVDERCEMRLDIIAIAKYGDKNKAYVIQKFNGLKNPYNVPLGTILAIPNLDSWDENTGIVDYPQNNIIRDSVGSSGKKTQNSTSNRSISNRNAFKIDGSKIIF